MNSRQLKSKAQYEDSIQTYTKAHFTGNYKLKQQQLPKIQLLFKKLCSLGFKKYAITKLAGLAVSIGLSISSQAQQFELQTFPFQGSLPQNLVINQIADVDNDGDLDVVGLIYDLEFEYEGEINLYPNEYLFENIGSNENPSFNDKVLVSPAPFLDDTGNIIHFGNAGLADIDQDGDLDVFRTKVDYINNTFEDLLFINNSNSFFEFNFSEPIIEPFASRTEIGLGRNFMIDIDQDGDLDLLTDNMFYYNFIEFIENIGNSSSPEFGPVQNNPFGFSPSPLGEEEYGVGAFMDFDLDGDLDFLIPSRETRQLNIFLNSGSLNNPQFSVSNNVFEGLELSLGNEMVCFDIDNDGDLEVLSVSSVYSNGDPSYQYFKNNTLEVSTSQTQKILVNAYPNPVSSILNLTSEFPIQELSIFSITGKLIYSENNSNQINLDWLAKGVYQLTIRFSNGLTFSQSLIKE